VVGRGEGEERANELIRKGWARITGNPEKDAAGKKRCLKDKREG